MKKLFYFIAVMMVMSVLSCHKRVERITSSGGWDYVYDTLSGHTYYFDKHGMMEDHECKKCEERLVFILDSIIDDRVVKLLGK
jgi:hypothetical protein